MSAPQANNPLHGVTLENMLKALVARHGWARLGELVNIRCFNNDPSIASSLKFLRRTDWARQQVEALYLEMAQSQAATKAPAKKTPRTMRYEAYLDEVTTLITEKYDVADEAAIDMVMRAQDAEYFVPHDDDARMRTEERAHDDARHIFKTWGPRG